MTTIQPNKSVSTGPVEKASQVSNTGILASAGVKALDLLMGVLKTPSVHTGALAATAENTGVGKNLPTAFASVS